MVGDTGIFSHFDSIMADKEDFVDKKKLKLKIEKKEQIFEVRAPIAEEIVSSGPVSEEIISILCPHCSKPVNLHIGVKDV